MSLQRPLVGFVVLSFLLIIFSVSPSYAQGSCSMSTSLISARKTRFDGSPVQKQSDMQLLRELDDQLASLPFSSYRVEGSSSSAINVGESVFAELRHSEQGVHKLAVKTQSVHSGKVASRVDWYAPSGEVVLNAKLKIPNNKHVVFLSENDDYASTLVSVKLVCR